MKFYHGMRFFFFGRPAPGNYILDEAKRMDTWEGLHCNYCGEVITWADAGYGVSFSEEGARLPLHNNCFLLAMNMMPGYLYDEELSRRENADLAFKESFGE